MATRSENNNYNTNDISVHTKIKNGNDRISISTGESLQERTLVVKNLDIKRMNRGLLQELFMQGGPVRSVFLRESYAMVEFEDAESVGYCLALFRDIKLFGRRITIEPKVRRRQVYQAVENLDDVEAHFRYEKSKLVVRGTGRKPRIPTHGRVRTKFKQIDLEEKSRRIRAGARDERQHYERQERRSRTSQNEQEKMGRKKREREKYRQLKLQKEEARITKKLSYKRNQQKQKQRKKSK